MKEINIKQKEIKKEKKPEDKPLIEKYKELKNFKEKVLSEGIKKKKVKLPSKAKVRRGKLKKGWIGILKIDENRNISMEKQKVSGNTYLTKDGYYRVTDGREMIFWNGKFPVVIQPTWRQNPIEFNPKDEKNEVYGDKYKMARMLADTIKTKKKGGSIIIWIIIGAAVLFGINWLSGGGLI